ncbi:MAG: aminodeoxychorismate/anthranilate synthase component II [Candidatus Zixiibacteriota bacterium]
MLFVLDNYDSFTYNLVQYLAETGSDVCVARNDEVSVSEVLAMRPSGIVLSPGPGRPENAGILEALIREAAGKVPILGVCLGHQAIGRVFGAQIEYAPSLMHGKTSVVCHDGSLLFRGVNSPMTAGRYHSLVVAMETVPQFLAVTAWSDDGVVMGIAHRQWPVYGVQFHPESVLTPSGRQILDNFVGSLET